MERLKVKGNSALLLRVAESIGSVTEPIDTLQSVNVMNIIMLNAMPGSENKGHVSKTNRVFQIADDNDLFEVDKNADRIEVMKGMCNDRDIVRWDLSEYQNLVELLIEEKCFQFVTELKVNGFEFLETFVVGSECFTKEGGVLEISCCSALKSVRIGKGSFAYWKGFVMKECGVEEVEIGDDCFVECEKTVFQGEREKWT